MEQYRIKIKRRKLFLVLFVIFMILFNVNHRYGWIELPNVKSEIMDFWQGLFVGWIIICSITILRYNSYVRDAKKLAILYNKENDERTKTIKQKAGMPLIIITSSLMFIAAMIAGFYNITVFYTLVITGVIQLSIGSVIKVIYMKVL